VSVSGLPPTGSWQDLKDHFREVGDVIYTDVFRDGMGVVEFSRRDSIRTAVKHLDDSKFRSHEVCCLQYICLIGCSMDHKCDRVNHLISELRKIPHEGPVPGAGHL
jgi:hypothetical protein